MRTLGVIPARGGSKRVPRKNLRQIRGVPLIGYTIRACQAATSLTDWLVSTDDEEIANVALSYGAFVIGQPMASDTSTSGEVCRYALDLMEDFNPPYDIIMCLHPTSPIRDPEHIDQAVDALSRSQLETLASVYMLPRKPFENVKCLTNGRLVEGSEDIWANCVYNASIYAMKRRFLLATNQHTSTISVPLVMDRFHSLDVDEEIDLKIAELFINELSPKRL